MALFFFKKFYFDYSNQMYQEVSNEISNGT